MAAGVLDELRGGVEAHGLAVEQAAEEGGGFEAFEPGGEIHQQREAGRVGFGEAVAAEAFDLAAQALGEFDGVAALGHAGEELVAIAFELALAAEGAH